MIIDRRRMGTAGVLAACLAALLGSTVVAAAADVPPTPTDEVAATTLGSTQLDVLQGQDAVDALVTSGDLAGVAADSSVAPHELVDELIGDPTMFLTDGGALGYADVLTAAPSPTSAALTTVPPGVNVFALSSQPWSSRVIYLDFNGHSTADAGWVAAGAPAVIDSAPFDIDGVAGFSDAEQAIIYEVWQRVVEDYLPFDVNVTTVDPGVEALRKTSPIDAAYGQRMVISPTNWVGAGVLGVALLNSFDASVDRPGFVFTAGANTKTIAEAVSHEAGHTFGLLHDGTSGSAYYNGHGVWAPIMGRSISASTPVSQWSRGEYAGANNAQDDIAIIASYTDPRPDDHGGTSDSATLVASTSTTGGFIGTTGDRDDFAVQAGPGTLSATLQPPTGAATWSNLLARLVVRNSAGAVVGVGTPSLADPSRSWTASVNVAIPADRYTLEVEPIGWLDASTGFTTYGSLGAYQLSVSVVPGAAPPVPGASTFTAVTPTRLVDTRNGVGGLTRLGAGRAVVIQVADGVTVPTGATAAVFSIAAVNPSAAGFVTAYPCTANVPDASTLNFVAGQTVANNTIAALSSAGQLCVWTYSDTDILVDITGWIGPSGSSRLTPIGPTRVVDTRSGVGGGRLAAGATMAVDLNGRVPAGSSAVALNVTAVGASAPAFLTVFPCNGAIPSTSTINYVAGEARPNNTIVGLTGGRVCIYSYAATDVLVDLVGSFGPTGYAYQPVAPARVLDTRQTQPLGPGAAIGYSVAAPALGGAQPGAAFVNVTAVNHRVDGYVTTYDCVVRRDTSTLNQRVGQATANGAIVPLAGLQSCAWTYGGGDLIVDLNGWWVP